MMIVRPLDLLTRRLLLLAFVAATLAAICPARAGDEPKDSEKLPDGVSAISKEHLNAKVPSFFSFDYPFNPQPGKRLWLRVDNKIFVERYPDGAESRYQIVGHADVRGMAGTVVVKTEGEPQKTGTTNDNSFQVFIPDKGNDEMAILFRHLRDGQGEWLDMSWSLKKKTIIQKVE